jgi:hypothetical protein
VNLVDSSFTSDYTITSQNSPNDTTNLIDRKSGTTVIEASFFFFPHNPGRSNGELWFHETCGDLNRAEHDLGRIVIKKNELCGTRRSMLLTVKLDISEEGLLFRKPILKMSRGTQEQIPITWESSSLSFSKDMMDNVRVQLADEMKTFHHQYNLTVDGN